MKWLQYVVVLSLGFLIIGCTSKTTNGLDNYQGSSEAKLKVVNTQSYNTFKQDNNATAKCLEENDKLEIWLDDIKYDQIFEGKMEKFLDQNALNEIAIIISLYGRNIGENNQTIIKENIMLEFKNGIAKNVSPNSDDAFIRAIKIKKDQDITIKIEVIEYDEQIKKTLDDAKESFTKLLNSKIVNNIITGITSDTVELISDEFVGSMLNRFTINDLLMKHETVLHFCKTIPNQRSAGERYLAEGTLGILRMPFDKDADTEWTGKKLKKIPSNSFLKLRLVKRENSNATNNKAGTAVKKEDSNLTIETKVKKTEEKK